MATYKVLQDIEAEDKLVGPFSLRQFIYAAIVLVLGFISFKLLAVSVVLAIPLVFPMLFFGLLAAPIGTEQSSEIWLLAKIKFFLKPHRRIWDQTGIEQLVTITAPPKITKQLTDNLTQTEVKSRLKALATTLDSRGWAVKSDDLNITDQSFYNQPKSDRLIDAIDNDNPSNLASDITAGDDIMDASSNPLAQNLDALIKKSEETHRKGIISNMQNGEQGPPPNYGFILNPPKTQVTPPGFATFNESHEEVLPGENNSRYKASADDKNASDQAFLKDVINKKKLQIPNYKHLTTLDPLSGAKLNKKTGQAEQKTEPASQDSKHNPDILRLAGNDDLNISTIAREAHKSSGDLNDDEVYIPLH